MAIIQTPDGRFFNIPKDKADEVADKLKDFEMSPEEIEAEINKMKEAQATRPVPAPRAPATGGTTVVNIFCNDGPPVVRQGQGDVEGYNYDPDEIAEDVLRAGGEAAGRALMEALWR